MSTAAVPPQWSERAVRLDERRARPLPPGSDPFHDPPSGWRAAPPGTVLRSRDVRVGFLARVPLRVRAVQLLYRTCDMHRRPSTTVTTVLLADDAPPTQDRPLVSYQSAIDALTREAFPSYTLRLGAPVTGEVVQLEILLVANALAQGWAVSIPDHEGPDGLWGAPRESGYCTLDGVRAALGLTELDLSERSAVTLWGYSGGGWGTSWGAELAAGYAPELRVVGAVLGSPVGDPERVFRRGNGHAFAGLSVLVIAGLMRAYPQLRTLVEQHLSAKGRAAVHEASTMSTGHALLRYAFTDIGRYLDQPLEEFLDHPTMRSVFDDIRPGQGTPSMPVLLLQAVHDQIIPVAAIDEMALGYADRRTPVTYLRDRLSEHFAQHVLSAPLALEWQADRFAGVPAPRASTTTLRSVIGSPRRLRTAVRMVGVCARVALGRTLSTT